MAFSNGLDLAKNSYQRLAEAANFKRSQLVIYTAAANGLEINAELIDIRETSDVRFTGEAIFRIDKMANNLPFDHEVPTKRYFERGIKIKQTLASEIIEAFGIGGVIYLGTQTVTTVAALAPLLSTAFNMTIAAGDLVDNPIAPGTTCVLVRFHPLSIGYKGSFRVDIATPVAGGVPQQM